MTREEKTIGPYQLGKGLGRDASGRSYASEAPEGGSAVTIKVLDAPVGEEADASDAFAQAIESAIALKHPYILQILEHGEESGQRYLVMEERPEADLYGVLKRRKLSLQEAFRLFRLIAGAVKAAHGQGIVQGDLSSRTIAVSEDLSVLKLTEIGLPGAVASAGGRTLTSTAGGTGALHFIAPERAVDPTEDDPRVDIYSLGVIFYQMLTGKVPVGRFNLPSRVHSAIPPEVDPVVLKCLAVDRSQRYSDVASLLRDVERLEDRLGLGLARELRGIGQSIRRPTKTLVRHARELVTAAAVLVALAAGGYGLWKWMNRPSPPRQPVESTVRDPLAGRPSESLAVAIAAVVPPEPETSETPAEAAGEEGATSTTALESAVEVGREAYEIAAEKARNNLHAQAVEDLDQILAASPSLNVEADVLSLRAQIEEVQGRTRDAMGTYTEIGKRFEGRKLQVWARYNFARLALKSDLPDRSDTALGVFQEVADRWPSSEYAPKALASKAAIETSLKTKVDDDITGRKVPLAFVTSRTLIEAHPNAPEAELALRIVADQYEELKLWRKAADTYWQLGTGFPETSSDAWWKAGQILDRRLDNRAAALRAYEQVPQSSEHYGAAQKRINRLSK